MIASTHAQHRRATLGATALVLGVLLFVPAAPAHAATAPHRHTTTGKSAVSHPEDDDLGSQIARYEGRFTGPTPRKAPAPVVHPHGLDVSSHQPNVNWPAVAAAGARFVYVKATESVTYANPLFGAQYHGAALARLLHGAYHFALPDRSDGATQADFFLAHGGGWVRDGKTLPPAVDMEYNPYGEVCYGLAGPPMVAWVRAFSDRIKARTGRYPMIYTSTNWWARCTGNDVSIARTDPLWIPRYGPQVGPLPAGWPFHTIWQFANRGTFPGDQDSFNGSLRRLRLFALGR